MTTLSTRSRNDASDPSGLEHTEGKHAQDAQQSKMDYLTQAVADLRELETSLPVVRHFVLQCTSKLSSLWWTVKASRIIHTTYLKGSDEILRSCLNNDIQKLVVDAVATLTSRDSMVGPTITRTNAMIEHFLQQYWFALDGPGPRMDINKLDDKYVCWLAAHHRCIDYALLVREYSHWALGNLFAAAPLSDANSKEAEMRSIGSADPANPQLTVPERTRIRRALYRYETYHNLFGRNTGGRDGFYLDSEVNGLFFSRFCPWEAEAIGCIELFVRDYYERLFDRAEVSDLEPENPEFEREMTAESCPEILNFHKKRNGKQTARRTHSK